MLLEYILAIFFGFAASIVLWCKLYYMGVTSLVYSLEVGLLTTYIFIMVFSRKNNLYFEQIKFPYKINIKIHFRRRNDVKIYESKKLRKRKF